MVEKLDSFYWAHKSLPEGIATAARSEAQEEAVSVLEALRTSDIPQSVLSHSCRRVERLRDYAWDPVETHIDITIELWRLVQVSTVGYRLRRRCATLLHQRLRGLRKEFSPARGLQPLARQNSDVLAKLRACVNWRTVKEMLVTELDRSFRGAPLEQPSHWEHFADHLAPLVNELRHWTAPEEAPEIVSALAPLLDPSQRSIVLFARLMLMALPTEASEQFIESGQLYRWWELLPSGANARYSLMWIVLPARCAKSRWASGNPRAAGHVLPAERLSYTFDTFAEVMILPVGDHKTVEMDTFTDNYQWAFLGGSLYRLVAKFIVYSLEPLESQDFPEGSMWELLGMLCRRLHPCMIHAGAWTWHIQTFLHELARSYYVRVCRERFREPGCKAHASFRLTAACDDAFVNSLGPLLTDGMTLRSSGDLHAAISALSFVSRLSLLNSNRWAEVKVFLQGRGEDLADPMSTRHVSTVELLAEITPCLVYAAPQLLIDAAFLALPGLDVTDPMKTSMISAFFLNLFVQIPALDLSSQKMPQELPNVLDQVVPVPPRNGSLVLGASAGELQMATSAIPTLCCELLDRFLEYVRSMPKPSKKDRLGALNLIGPRMLATTFFLVLRQSDASTNDRMTTRLIEWLGGSIASNSQKAVCKAVGAFSLASAEVSARLMDAALGRLRLAKGGIESLGEPEALWHLAVLAAAARFGEVGLLTRRASLETAVSSALADRRKSVRKSGAKLVRRILTGLTSPYCRNITGLGTLDEALMRWAGGGAVHWGTPSKPLVVHVPNAEELEFSSDLLAQTLKSIREKVGGTDSEIHLGLCLAKAVVRGVAALYPDEREGETARPTVGTLPNTWGPKILEELSDVLLSLCSKLASPAHPLEAKAGDSDRPKLLCKALRMIVSLLRGERAPEIPDLLQIRGFDGHGHIRGAVSQESFTRKVHYMSWWRDMSPVWYNWEVVLLLNRRLAIRGAGFKLEGVRRKLGETVASYALSGNSMVRATATTCLRSFLRVHFAAKQNLLERTLLPMHEKSIALAQEVTRDRAHLLEAAMEGFACVASQLIAEVWRTGAACALRFAAVLVRIVNSLTRSFVTVDVRPQALSSQFDLLAKWCTAQVAVRLGNAQEASDAANYILELLQPSTHWRARTCALAVVGVGLRALHLTGTDGLDPKVLRTWIGELLEGISTGAPQTAQLAVTELTTAMRSALRWPNSTLASVLAELLPNDGIFLGQAVRAMCGLHIGHINGASQQQDDSVQCVVNAAIGKFRVPQLSWIPCPSGHACAIHAAFTQTYVSVRKQRGDTELVAELSSCLASLHAQPKTEAEDHLAFVEILAGTLRAARRWPEQELAALWEAVGPTAAEELQTTDDENVVHWQFLVEYLVCGVSRRLRPKADEPSEDASVRHLMAFLEVAEADTADAGSRVFSRSDVTKLRLLQVALSCLRRKRPAVSDSLRARIIQSIAPALKEGITHQFQHVREGSAKAMVMTLHLNIESSETQELLAWLSQHAEEQTRGGRFLPKDSPLSAAFEGLIYTCIHGLLRRRLRDLSLDLREVLLIGASAEDSDLRALAGVAIAALGLSRQRLGDAVAGMTPLVACCDAPGVSGAPRTHRLKAAVSLLGAYAMRHHFVLSKAGPGVTLCKGALVTALADEQAEVRTAAQGALVPLLGAQASEGCQEDVRSFSDVGPDDPVEKAVLGLGAMLRAGGTLGCPAWLGGTIEALAKASRRPKAKKEVERVIQEFMRQQQQSQDLWRRCQSNLTRSQMDTLKSSQSLSYYV